MNDEVVEKLLELIEEWKDSSGRNNEIGLDRDMPFHRGVSHGLDIAIDEMLGFIEEQR